MSHAGLLIDQDARVLTAASGSSPDSSPPERRAGGILGNRYVGGGTAMANAVVNGRSSTAAVRDAASTLLRRGVGLRVPATVDHDLHARDVGGQRGGALQHGVRDVVDGSRSR